MKKLINLLTAITLSTATSISAIGSTCSCNVPVNEKLNEQVAKDLGLIDMNGKSLAMLHINIDHVNWVISGIPEITPVTLINFDDKAISKESEDFLINILKCTKDNQGKFKRGEVRGIVTFYNEINPILSKNTDDNDYEVTGGTFKLGFIKGTEILRNYTMDLAINDKDIIKSIIDNFHGFGIDYNSFNEIPNFKAGIDTDNTKPANDDDLYSYLKHNESKYIYQKLELLNRLINKGDKIKIIVTDREITSNNSHWKSGDSLKVKIKFGIFTSFFEHKLKLP